MSIAVALLLATPTLAESPRSPEDAAKVATALAPPIDFTKPEAFEANPGGAATIPFSGRDNAFSLPSPLLTDKMRFTLGAALFQKLWIAAPTSTKASDGLGPLYNARACLDCHVNLGRGSAPDDAGKIPNSFLLRLGNPDLAATRAYLSALPDPTYGSQLQAFAAPGQIAEGKPAVTYTPLPVTLSDGTTIILRAPAYSVSQTGYGPLATGTLLSPRAAPQMIGLGLLEAIPETDILARQDPDDTDHDGISGRANWWTGEDGPHLGRFGLKAGQPSVRHQSAQAFLNDLGLSTLLHPTPWGDCTETQSLCRNAPHGQEPDIRDGLEVDGESMTLTTYFTENLAVPARRNVGDPTVLRGKELFHALACTACHTPKHVTARLSERPEQSFQLIWPYTDLLLHDMGPGLADSLPEGHATGSEWRTPPLWGIGLTKLVSPRAGYLHDARARTILEAILWHGGEAEPHRNAVIALPKPDREALLAFLESL